MPVVLAEITFRASASIPPIRFSRAPSIKSTPVVFPAGPAPVAFVPIKHPSMTFSAPPADHQGRLIRTDEAREDEPTHDVAIAGEDEPGGGPRDLAAQENDRTISVRRSREGDLARPINRDAPPANLRQRALQPDREDAGRKARVPGRNAKANHIRPWARVRIQQRLSQRAGTAIVRRRDEDLVRLRRQPMKRARTRLARLLTIHDEEIIHAPPRDREGSKRMTPRR
jgi:hypothetical protein